MPVFIIEWYGLMLGGTDSGDLSWVQYLLSKLASGGGPGRVCSMQLSEVPPILKLLQRIHCLASKQLIKDFSGKCEMNLKILTLIVFLVLYIYKLCQILYDGTFYNTIFFSSQLFENKGLVTYQFDMLLPNDRQAHSAACILKTWLGSLPKNQVFNGQLVSAEKWMTEQNQP